MNLQERLEQKTVTTSVPCRVDFGGTLDISTMYLSLMMHDPSCVNLALDMRTRVSLMPWKKGKIKVSSRGFTPAEFDHGAAPFAHPMGLMFAVAAFFDAHGVHITIESGSPPRSALGGSSSAAVAIVSAFFHLMEKSVDPARAAWLAHYIEAGVAGVPCGMQDQLAAAFGGVNQWCWKMGGNAPEFEKIQLCSTPSDTERLNRHCLFAYCGIPHESKDINGQWVRSFLSGESRDTFREICDLTKQFASAIKEKQFALAAELMNFETGLRCRMTPEVLDATGKILFEKASTLGCGARFTGAGGGGCLWAVGDQTDIEALRPAWQEILDPVQDAVLLDAKIDNTGIIIH